MGASVNVGQAGDSCDWYNATAVEPSSCTNIKDSGNWTLVRALIATRNRWFSSWDSLDGTGRYYNGTCFIN